MDPQEATLDAGTVKRLAREAGFELVGLARAQPLAPDSLKAWLEAGFHADLDWMAERFAQRLDVSLLLPGAKTVVALACNYHWDDAEGPIARYARGRDYHATLRDRLRALRRAVRARWPGVQDYGSVDASPVMEKVWAVRAGLGFVGKNGCLITREYGSWVVLAAFVLDAAVSAYDDEATVDRCGTCRLCVEACPTDALSGDRSVDARACLAYQTIENGAPVPEALRPALEGLVFGCDICQAVCPLSNEPVRAGARFAPRPISSRSVEQLAALTRAEYDALVPGTPLARVQYDGLRRNAAYALGAAREPSARPLLTALAQDSSAAVREAAQWALTQLP